MNPTFQLLSTPFLTPRILVLLHLLSLALTGILPLHADPAPQHPDPFFRNNIEIWLDSGTQTNSGVGTELDPFHVGTTARFDTFMRSFKATPNITFRFKPGIYFTSGTYESRSTNEFGTFWEPFHGWRILGSGIDSTFLILTNVPKTAYSTKFQTIGNINSYGSGHIEHVEIAHMTINANGLELVRRNLPIGPNESNYGCVVIQGNHVHLHDLKCIGGHRAMRPDGPNVGRSTELFILGISAPPERSVTNGLIEFCHVINPPTNRNTNNPTRFPSKNNDITTGIIISASPQSRTNFQAYSYYPQIRFCQVEGNGYDTIFNPLSMFGCVQGLVVSNVVHHSRNGFYNDDGIFTPSLSIHRNLFSDVLFGLYWNHTANFSRIGELSIEDNQIELCRNCLPPDLTFTAGIAASGNPDGLTFVSLYISGNYITSIQQPPPNDFQDFGLILGNVRKVYAESNIIALARRQTSSRITYPFAELRSQIQFCHNVNAAGSLLAGYDMTTALCQSLNTNRGNLDIPACTLDEICLEPSRIRSEFPLAGYTPKPLVYPSVLNEATHFIAWEAEHGEISGDFKTTNAVSLSSQKAIMLQRTGTNLAFGRARYMVHIPNAGRYYLWARLYAGKQLRTSFDVEVDGERRWFLATLRPDPVGTWDWFVVSEILDPNRQDTRPRILFFTKGWHEITFWGRHVDTGIDALCLTTVPPLRLELNDPLVIYLENTKDSAARFATDCPWEFQFEAESMKLAGPTRIAKDLGPQQPVYLTSAFPDRGSAQFTFEIPRSDDYRMFVRLRRKNSVYNSIGLNLDGRAWIVVANSQDDWSWSSNIGNTESEALTRPISSLRLSAGVHQLELQWREPDVAVDQIFLESLPR